MMVFYYNELTTKKPLKRYISFEEAQEWRKRLKTNTRAQKMSIQDIIQKKSQAWKILIHETLENRSLSFSGEDLAHEGIFLEEDTLDEQTEQTERKQQDERDKQDTRDEQDQCKEHKK
ncbi:hypothetical protein BDF14DRAFT_1140841 [Spinellus fusiger]|nr:hypothetical protein BDF14DRAFT_1140841 [Spinellus fusiger]